MENYENIDIKRIIEIAFSNIILIIMILILCLSAGYGYSYYYKTPKYSSAVTILLAGDESETETEKEVTQNDLTINSGLISTYSNIATSSSILEKTIQNLGLNISVQELQSNVTAKQVGTTQFLKISVINNNPEQACNIANEIAKIFTEEIKNIYNLQNINIVDNAEVASAPYNINHKKDMLIFAFVGIVLSGILVMAIYLFDDTIKDEKDIEQSVKLKNLGTLPIDKNNEGLIVEKNPKSHIVECIKTLRTNMLYATNKSSILFTSYNKNEGKSWVINNLAITFAQANKKVILLDANLRTESEKIKTFEIENGEGLSDFIKEITDNKLKNLEKSKKYIKETKIPNLHIMQSGTIPPNPVALLSSENMRRLLDLLKTMYDVVLIDGMACSEVSDSIALSSMVDSTILIAENKKTKLSEIKKVKRAIEDVNGNVLGVILNKVNLQKGKYYGKKYGYGYYYGNKTEEIGKIEDKQNLVSLTEIIEVAKENIKQELENKKEKIVETTITEEAENKENIESQKIQTELQNMGTEVKKEIRKLKTDIAKNKSEQKFNELNEKIEAINYDKNFEELNNKIENNNYEEIMKDLVAQVIQEITSINEEIKKLKEQQEIGNSELVEKIADIETEKSEIIEQLNKIEENRVEQNTEILKQISKMEENRIQQNSELVQKLEKIEISNNEQQAKEIEDAKKDEKVNSFIDNIITIEELRERSKRLRNRTFNISEEIKYEDLEALSTTVIDLKPNTLSDVASK